MNELLRYVKRNITVLSVSPGWPTSRQRMISKRQFLIVVSDCYCNHEKNEYSKYYLGIYGVDGGGGGPRNILSKDYI